MPVFRLGKDGRYYNKDGSAVTDQKHLDYIKSLVIPPAYRDVEVYYTHMPRGPKILYMGYDAKDRPQFIYAKWWGEQQRGIKLCNLIEFGEALPKIQGDVARYLTADRWTLNKTVSLIIRIISLCYFRIGNIKYETLYKSHGISTITSRHVKFTKAGAAEISFTGKKSMENHCIVTDAGTVRLLRELVELKKPMAPATVATETKTPEAKQSADPHVFMYQEGGSWHHVSHLDVNDFLKRYNPTFTSKMFRTFDTNTMLIDYIDKHGMPPDPKPTARKRLVNAALRAVSESVHNTLAVCRKDYADPELIRLYLEHPRKYRGHFNNDLSSRTRFVNWLRARGCLATSPVAKREQSDDA